MVFGAGFTADGTAAVGLRLQIVIFKTLRAIHRVCGRVPECARATIGQARCAHGAAARAVEHIVSRASETVACAIAALAVVQRRTRRIGASAHGIVNVAIGTFIANVVVVAHRIAMINGLRRSGQASEKKKQQNPGTPLQTHHPVAVLLLLVFVFLGRVKMFSFFLFRDRMTIVDHHNTHIHIALDDTSPLISRLFIETN